MPGSLWRKTEKASFSPCILASYLAWMPAWDSDRAAGQFLTPVVLEHDGGTEEGITSLVQGLLIAFLAYSLAFQSW